MKKFNNYWQKFEEFKVYHIYNRCIKGEKLFHSNENYLYFLEKWNKFISPFMNTLGYCLIPNHFHFLVQLKEVNLDFTLNARNQKTVRSKKFLRKEISYNDFLEDQFKRLFQSYAMSINKQQKRYGALFQKRFKRISITEEYKILHLLSYIHHNPIHHKLENDFSNWKFSSYSGYISGQSNILDSTSILEWLSTERPSAIKIFKEYHDAFKMQRRHEQYYLDEGNAIE